MNILIADKLASSLVRTSDPCKAGKRVLRATIEGERIVFSGGSQGSHSLDISVSSPERVLAHWEGYCENNGMRPKPSVGDRVLFPSSSARGTGWRVGLVVAVGPKRARIEFTYKHGGMGKSYLPIKELRFS